MNMKDLARLLYESKYVVCISGREMIVEDGIDSMRNMETAYDIEMKYGYSPEEVFGARFFNTRTEKFYEFYREEVLGQDKEPGAAYAALAEMEKLGILKYTITRQLYNFPKRAGCKKVYNLHGNIYEKNKCPRCGKEYPMEYLRDSEKVPLCEKCRVPIHPGVTLLGEMVEIGLTTKAADEVSRADVLLLAGAHMRSELVDQFMRYFHGKCVLLVHAGHHFGDKDADIFINASAAQALPILAAELKRLRREDEEYAGETEDSRAEAAVKAALSEEGEPVSE